jgi:hypothetical protein
VPIQYRIDHPYPICVATGLSFQQAPDLTYIEPRIFIEAPHLLSKSKPKVSGAQIEAFLRIMSRFTSDLENGCQPGFLLGMSYEIVKKMAWFYIIEYFEQLTRQAAESRESSAWLSRNSNIWDARKHSGYLRQWTSVKMQKRNWQLWNATWNCRSSLTPTSPATDRARRRRMQKKTMVSYSQRIPL